MARNEGATGDVFDKIMNSLVWLAIVLFILWVLAKMVFAVGSLFLHILWIAALIMAGIWLFNKFVRKT